MQGVTPKVKNDNDNVNPNFASDRRYDLKEGFLHVREDFSVDERCCKWEMRRRRWSYREISFGSGAVLGAAGGWSYGGVFRRRKFVAIWSPLVAPPELQIRSQSQHVLHSNLWNKSKMPRRSFWMVTEILKARVLVL
jgi:hypothetical protein